MPKYGPLSPWQWPQDTLAVPNGQGLMPAVEFQNAVLNKREFFIYSASLVLPTWDPTSVVIPIAADADFWASTLVVGYTTDAALTALLTAQMQVRDLRTGNALFEPYVETGLFAGTYATRTLTPTNPLIQPYCFTRNGGIEITVSNPAGTTVALPVTFYFNFIGWKEYTYASR